MDEVPAMGRVGKGGMFEGIERVSQQGPVDNPILTQSIQSLPSHFLKEIKKPNHLESNGEQSAISLLLL